MIDGEIVNVMESWPLQLTVQTAAGRYHVRLLEGTIVTRRATTVGPGVLRPELRVRIRGSRVRSTPLVMSARVIEILR